MNCNADATNGADEVDNIVNIFFAQSVFRHQRLRKSDNADRVVEEKMQIFKRNALRCELRERSLFIKRAVDGGGIDSAG